eukprot:scaffold178030_cov21-Tisochrysis_lutea.AAC.3
MCSRLPCCNKRCANDKGCAKSIPQGQQFHAWCLVDTVYLARKVSSTAVCSRCSKGCAEETVARVCTTAVHMVH